MIARPEDLFVVTEADFERLPEDGRWEVVEGRAILLPGSDVEHQFVCDVLWKAFDRSLTRLGFGHVISAPNVRIPVRSTDLGMIQNRIPDVVVFRTKPRKHFALGSPPELVIEVLATRRGNVERTEKIEDYARAGIGEYWIVQSHRPPGRDLPPAARGTTRWPRRSRRRRESQRFLGWRSI